MSTPTLLVFVLLGLCGNGIEAKLDRRIYKQLNAFKTSVTEEIGFLREDIDTLFESLKNVTSKKEQVHHDVPQGKAVDVVMTGAAFEDKLMTIGNLVEQLDEKYSRLMHAFETEKTLDRKSNEQITSNKDSIADIYKLIANNKKELSEKMSMLNRKSNEQVTSIKNSIADLYQLIAANKNELSEDMSVLKQQTLEEKGEKKLNQKSNEQITSNKESIVDIYQRIANINRTVEEKFSSVGTTRQPALSDSYCKQEIGVKSIYVDSISSIASVYCDREADGEVWATFMRRANGQVNFTRPWAEYKKGFGKADGEFWSGNELLHRLTTSKPMQLRIDMTDFDGNKAFAQYETFQVGSEGDKYRLTVDGYSGNAGDSLISSSNGTNAKYLHNGMMFSTFDSDNDNATGNCAETYAGGWWFNRCFLSSLTGVYHEHGSIIKWRGIIWYTWTGWQKALKFVEMKVR